MCPKKERGHALWSRVITCASRVSGCPFPPGGVVSGPARRVEPGRRARRAQRGGGAQQPVRADPAAPPGPASPGRHGGGAAPLGQRRRAPAPQQHPLKGDGNALPPPPTTAAAHTQTEP